MNALAAVLVTSLASAPPPAPEPAVRLVPFQCAGISDVELRPLLKVELRDRLIDEPTPAAADFILVSIACDVDTANIVSVPQAAGSPVRRQLRLATVSPDARPRNLAVAVAELLRAPPGIEAEVAPETPRPAFPSVDRADDEDTVNAAAAPARLELVEPAILMPLTTARRTGVRTRAGSTYVPEGMLLGGAPNYYVFGIEPFVELPIGRSAVASFTVPVTGTEGPGVSSWGRLGNLTAALRYASGEGLRVGVGAALSVNVADVPEAQAMSNLFELDRYRDATESLRLQADALWRSGKLYLQGEVAVLVLVDEHVSGALLRPGISAGISLSRVTFGAEYLVLADPGNHYFRVNDRVVQALIVGTRLKASATATLGLSLYAALDQALNVGSAGTFSTAWTF